MAEPIEKSENIGDDDLVELQPDKESIVTRLLAPKVIILSFLSLMFISKNIYYSYFFERETVDEPESPEYKPKPPAETDTPLMNQLYGFGILTVVLFIIYIILLRINDTKLLKKV